MAYTKTTWVNATTPINATNLNHIETGVDEAHDNADAATTTANAAIPSTIVDAKGDILVASGADTVTRLAVGTSGQVLSASAATSTGLIWEDSAGGGVTLPTYTISNVTTDRTYNANAYTTDELADVLGTLVADIVAGGGGGGSGGHTVQDEGSTLSARTFIDFAGTGVTVTDVSGSDKTLVTIPGLAGAPLAVSTKTAAYTTTTADDVILADATTAAFTVTLVTAVGNTGKVFHIKRTNLGVNAVTVDPNGAQTIDGFTTVTLDAQYSSISIVSNGSNWYMIGQVL